MSLQAPGSQNTPGGLAALVGMVKSMQARLSELERGALLRTAGIIARLGYIAGTTYDGTDRTHLGTTGWMLGSDDGGPSYLVLNGVDPIAELTAQQTTLTDAVADLAARVSVTVDAASFNTGSLPNDASYHTYGPPIPVDVDVPTGRLTVKIGCGQATLYTGGGAVIAEATFTISGGVAAIGDTYARQYAYTPVVAAGSSMSVEKSFAVPPGSYTVTGQMRAWATGSATSSIQFSKPYVTVQVTA